MRSQTRAGTIAAAPNEVYDYISRPENLPSWAPAFARSVRPEGDYWIATRPDGELAFKLRLNRDFGVVDFLVRVAPDVYRLSAPTRVVAHGSTHAEYLFTLFAMPAETNADFERRAAAIDDELATLARRFETAVRN